MSLEIRPSGFRASPTDSQDVIPRIASGTCQPHHCSIDRQGGGRGQGGQGGRGSRGERRRAESGCRDAGHRARGHAAPLGTLSQQTLLRSQRLH